MNLNSKNTCQDCGEKLFGRADKKYCDDHCRNNANNKMNTIRYEHIKQVNRILKSNWSILHCLYLKGKMRSNKDILIQLGFEFEYVTGIEIENGQIALLRCYNFVLIQNASESYELAHLE